MGEMVERVARKMAEAAGDDFSTGRSYWQRQARDLLMLMHEPTANMIEEGRWPAEDVGPVACWKAMIDEALR